MGSEICFKLWLKRSVQTTQRKHAFLDLYQHTGKEKAPLREITLSRSVLCNFLVCLFLRQGLMCSKRTSYLLRRGVWTFNPPASPSSPSSLLGPGLWEAGAWTQVLPYALHALYRWVPNPASKSSHLLGHGLGFLREHYGAVRYQL